MMKRIVIFAIALLWAFPVFAGTTETSGITAQTIADRAERSLNAAGSTFFADADWIQWIDAGVREIVNQTDCLEATAIELTLVANQRIYDPAQSFTRVTTVEYNNGDTSDDHQIIPLDRVHKNDIGHGDETGPPKVYCVWDDKIEIWPIPRADQAGDKIYVNTITLPTGVSIISSAIETPAYFDTTLLYYVIAQACYKDRRNSTGDRYMVLFDKCVKEYLILIGRKQPIE